ncbi:MAG: excinuclease ABC subunit A, partial [Bdellovibrionales bacterium]|nr:excinuclease ABC subunit A [Bdellovibrionales bacterium]
MSDAKNRDLKTIRLGDVHQNNLKGVNIEIPIGSFTVVCGPSGSGKSSLAFETLYAEGQRRYIESLSNYSKQFLNKAPKPDVGAVSNIPPAISIDQKNSVKSSRSTVGTTTEVIDYLRLIYEKIGKAYCPDHHISLERHSPSSGAKVVLKNFAGERGYVATKVSAEGRVEKGKKLLNLLIQDGYARIAVPAAAAKPAAKKKTKKKTAKKTTTKKVIQAKLSGSEQALQEWVEADIGEVIALDDPKLRKSGAPKGDFYIIIDRLSFNEDSQDRIVDSLAQAYSASIKFNKNTLAAEAEVFTTNQQRLLLNEEHSCTVCGFNFPPITSALFSFNSPVGACQVCNGFGNILTVDEAKVIPNPKLSLSEGAIVPFAMPSAKSDRAELKAYCKKAKIDMHTPWEELAPKQRKAIWEGNDSFYGVLGLFEYLETKKYKMHVRVFLSRYK